MDTIIVWHEKDGYIFYDINSGFFSASSNGWHGPDDFTIVGIYALAKPENKDFENRSFEDFKTEIYSKIENCKENLDEKITQTDLFWVYLGNRNYFYITGKMGCESPYDYYLLDQDEREIYCMSWDSQIMRNLIDKKLLDLSKDKSQVEIANDSKRNFNEIFIDYFIDNDIFTKTKL